MHDVRTVVAENTSNGVGVARGNETRCGYDVMPQRLVAATANSRDELNSSTSSCGSRNLRDTVSKTAGNVAFEAIYFIIQKALLLQRNRATRYVS